MANNVLNDSGTAYDPFFYANEAIIQLEKSLGMAARIHRGYEKSPQEKGSVIQIRKPATFEAQNAPSTAQDIDPGNTNIKLDQWKEVKFKLTDRELTLSHDQIIAEHIRPAAYALADNIDQALNSLYTDIPWHYDYSGTPLVSDLTQSRKVLFNNNVPLGDPGMLHMELNGEVEADLLGLAAFTQHQGSGDVGTAAQLRGQIGQRFGMNFFANQNAPSHVKGTLATSGTVAIDGAVVAKATTMTIDASTSMTGTLKAGDTFVVAGHTQRFAVTADATAAGNQITVNVTPEVPAAIADNAVVTFDVTTHDANLGFHSHAFALATAPLSDMANNLGARVATVVDPVTNLSLRSRVYYVGDSSEVHVALDVLYGVKTLDPNKAMRLRSNRS